MVKWFSAKIVLHTKIVHAKFHTLTQFWEIINLTVFSRTFIWWPFLSHNSHMMYYDCDQGDEHRLRIIFV